MTEMQPSLNPNQNRDDKASSITDDATQYFSQDDRSSHNLADNLENITTKNKLPLQSRIKARFGKKTTSEKKKF